MINTNTLMLIFSLAVLGILALAALVGFLAGFKREMRLTVVLIVLLLVVWLVLGNVSAVLDATLPGFTTSLLQNMLGVSSNVTTLRETIVEVIGDILPDFADLLVPGTHTYSFLMSVVEFALRFVILVVGTIVVYVLYLVIRLISFIVRCIVRLCTIKRRRRKIAEKIEQHESDLEDGVVVVKSDVYDGEVVVTVSRNPKKYRPYKKRRGLGAAIGVARAFLFVVLLCTPIAGLLSIVDEVERDTVDMVLDIMGGDTNGTVAAEGDTDMIDWLFELSDAYNDSAVGKTLKVPEYFLGKRLDDVFFDDLFKIETSTQTIYLREEIITLIKIANILPEAYDKTAAIPIDIWALDDAKQDELFDLLKQIKILYEIFPVAIEVAGELEMVQNILEPANQDLEGLKAVDWKVDLPYILDAVRAALELGDITSSEFDPLKLDCDVLREVVSNLGSTKFLHELMPVAINCALHMAVVEPLIGKWNGEEIVTDHMSWKTELLNLVDIYELFQELELDFSNIDINELIGNDNTTDVIETILVKLVTSDLFLDVLVPIVDVAKEFQLGELDFEQFKGLIELGQLEGADWEQDIKTLVEMAKLVHEIGVLSGEIDLYNYSAYRDLINGLFDLLILSDKVNVSGITVNGQVVELKTLLVEAALDKFNLFDVIEGEELKHEFTRFTNYDRGQIHWEDERNVFLALVDVYEDFVGFLESKGNTLTDFTGDLVKYLNYEETFDFVIDLLDTAVDSDLLLAILPHAIEKFAVPLINSFEEGAGFTDIETNDKISAGLTDNITSKTVAAEIFNIVYMVMDAEKMGLFTLLGEETKLNLGATTYIPEKYATSKRQASEEQPVHQLYADFEKYSEILEYRPADDDLAIVDIIQRLFGSTLLEGREGKVIRIALAVFLNVRVTKEDIYGINYSEQIENSTSEKDILVNAFNALKPILSDEDFVLFKEDGSFNLDYFLTTENIITILNGAITLFDSELIAVILPEVYNQLIVTKDIIPAELIDIFKVQSNWLAQDDLSYKDGLTGKELCSDVQTLMKMLMVVIEFNALDILDENKDLEFDGAREVFNEFFELLLDLNILEDNGDAIAEYVLKTLLDVNVSAEDFEAMDVNWGEETHRLINAINGLFDILENSEIKSYKELLALIDSPMDYLEQILVDENMTDLAYIIQQVGESHVLEVIAVPFINKFVVPLVEGLPEFDPEEYSGPDAAADIRALADILANIGEAKLMATIKAVLGEFTDLLPETDNDVVIPLAHEQYAAIIKDLLGLNLLNCDSVKQFVIDQLAGSIEGFDLSTIDVKNLDFANDGEILSNAYLKFFEEFKQDVFKKLTLSEILDLISGEKEVDVFELLQMVSKDNIYALGHLATAVLSTSIVEELGFVGFNYAKDLVPEEYAFLVNADLTKDQLVEDLSSLKEIVQAVLDIFGDSIDEIIDNLEVIAEDPMKLFELDAPLNLQELGENLIFIVETLDDMHLFNTRGDEIISGVLGIIGLEVAEEDIAKIDWQNEVGIAKDVATILEQLLSDLNITTLSSVQTELIDKLDTILENTDILNTTNVLNVLEIVDRILDSQLIEAVIEPAFDKYVADMIPEDLAEIVKFDESYTGADLLEDLNTVVSAVEDIVSLGIIENYINQDTPVNGDLISTTVIPAIEKLFSLNILEARETEIVEYIASVAGLEIVKLGDIEWENDGEILAGAAQTIANAIAKNNTIKTINDLLEADLIDIVLSDEELVRSLVDAVDQIVTMSIVEAFIPTALNFVVSSNMLPEEIANLINIDLADLENLDASKYVEDIRTILSIVDDALDMGILEDVHAIITNQQEELNVNWENPEKLVDIFEKVLGLNFFDNKKMETIKAILDILEVDSSTVDFDSIDTVASNKNILAGLTEIVELLEELEISSIKDAMDLANILEDNKQLAEVINTALPSVVELFELASEIDYIEELFVPLYDKFLQETLATSLGEFADLADLDFYTTPENAGKLSEDIATLGQVIQAVDESNIIDFVLGGENLDLENLPHIGDALQELFSLNLLAAKEQEIIAILNTEFEGLELSDQHIDFEADGEALADIIDMVVEVLESGVVTITTLDEIASVMDTLDYEVLFTYDEEHHTVVDTILDILESVTDLSFLDEGIGIATQLLKDSVPQELQFALDLGEKGSVGTVEDLKTIVSAIEGIYNLGIAQGYFNDEDASLLVGDELIAIFESICGLNYFVDKGDKFIEYAANEFGYPEILEKLPIDWNQEVDSVKAVIQDTMTLLENLEITSLENVLDPSSIDLMKILETENLDLVSAIVAEITDSILAQTVIGCGLFIALPIVADALGEPYDALLSLDNITIAELVEDIQDLALIVRDIIAMGILQGIADTSSEFDYDAQAIGNPELYAGQEVFELLFGLNYIGGKLQDIVNVVAELVPDFDIKALNVELLLSVDENGNTLIENDGIDLGAGYKALVEYILTNPNWKYNSIDSFDFSSIDFMEFYHEEYFTGINIFVNYLLELNILEAALPVVRPIISEIQMPFPQTIEFLLDATDRELIEDIISIWNAVYNVIDIYEFDYKDETSELLEGFALSKVNFNLAVIDAIPYLIETILNLHVFDQLTDERFELAVTEIITKFMPNFDLSRVNWDDLELIFDDNVASSLNVRPRVGYNDEVNRITKIFLIVTSIVNDLGFEHFADLYEYLFNSEADMMDKIIDLVSEDNKLNYNYVNSLLDILRLVVDSKAVSGLFYSIYDMMINLESMNAGLAEIMNLNPGHGYDSFAEIQADLHTIIDSIEKLVHYGFVEFVLLEAEMDWSQFATEAKANDFVSAISELLSIKALSKEGKLQQIIDYVSDSIFDISAVNTNEIDLGNDGRLIAEAIVILIDELLYKNAIDFDKLSDLEQVMNMNFITLAQKPYLLAVVDALDKIVETSIVEQALVVLADQYDLIVPLDFQFLFESGISAEALYEDVNSIVDILRAVVETELYVVLDGEDVSFDGLADELTTILDNLLHLNILSIDMANILENVLPMAGIEASYEDLATIDYDLDYQAIYNVLDIVERILVENSNIDTYNKLMDYINSIENINDVLYDRNVVSNENLHEVLNIVDNVVNMQLVKVLFDPIYEQMVSPMFEGAEGLVAILTDLEGYNVDMLLEDLNNIIDVLHEVVDLNALGIALDDATIDWKNSEAVDHLIETIFALNYLDVKSEALVEFVSENMFDISAMEIEAVDFVNDGKLIAEAVRILIDELLAKDVVPFDKVSDLEKVMNMNFMALLQKPYLLAVVDALDKIVETSIVEQALVVVADQYDLIVPTDFLFLFESGITAELLYEDVNSIVDILRAVVETELYVILDGEDVAFQGLADELTTILDNLLHLNILSIDMANILVNVLPMVGIEASYEDLATVDYDLDYQAIYNVLDIVERMLVRNADISTYNELMDYINSIENINYVLYDRNVLSNDNLHEVLNIVDNVVNMQLVKVLFDPIYEQMVSPMFEGAEGLVAILTDLEGYSVDMLLEDLNNIIDVLHEVVDVNALGIALDDATIDWENTEAVDHLIETIFALNYLDVKLQELLFFVSDNMFDISSVSARDLDLINDGKLIAEAIRILIDELLVKDVVPFDKVSDLEKVMNMNYMALLQKPYLLAVVDALDLIVDTTLVESAVTVVVDQYDMIVPADFQFLFETGISDELLYEDVNSIVDILRAVVETELYVILDGEDVSFVGLADELTTILDNLLHLNILSIDMANVLANVLPMAGIEVSYDELATVDYDLDYQAIYNVLDIVERMLVENSNIDTYNKLMDYINSIENINEVLYDRNVVSNENLHEVLNVVDNVVNMQLVKVLFDPIYEQMVSPMFEGAEGLVAILTDLEGYSVDMLLEDLNNIIDVLHEVVDLNALGIALDDATIDWKNSEAVDHLIETIFALNYLDVKLEELLGFVSDNVFNVSAIVAGELDLVNDGKLIAEAVRILIDELLANDVVPFDKVSDLEQVMNMNYVSLLQKPYLLAVVDALDKIVETTLVRQAMNVVMDQYTEFVPEDFRFVLESGITAELLYEDVNSIVDILRAAVETELYVILDGEDVSFVGLADELTTILDNVLHLNILSVDMAHILANVLPMVGIEVAYEDLATVNYDLDYEVIYGILDRVETMLVENAGIDTYFKLDELLQTVKTIDDVLYDRNIVSNENLHEALYIVEEVLQMQLVKVLFNPIYDQMVYPLFGDLGVYADLADLSDYSVDMLVEDLTNIVKSLHGLVDFNILGIALDDATISWETTIPVEQVIETIFAIQYLQVKEQAIIAIIDSFELGINISADELDLASDGEVLADIYSQVALLMKYGFEVDQVSEITDLVYNFKRSMIDDQIAQYVVNVLYHVDRFSFFKAGINYAFDMLEEVLPEDFIFLAEMGEAGIDGIVEDYNTIVDILQILVNIHVPSMLFQGYNMSLLVEYEAHQIIDLLFGMNYIGINTDSNKLDQFLDYAIGLVDSELVELIDRSLIDWDYEVDYTIKGIASEIIELLVANNASDYDSFMDYYNKAVVRNQIQLKVLATVVNGNGLLDIVEILLDSTLVDALAPVLYEVVMLILEPYYLGFLLDGMTPDMLIEDVRTIVGSVRNMVDDGALEVAVELYKDYQNTDLTSLARSFADEVPNILGIQMLSMHKDELVEFAVYTLNLNDYMLNYDAIVYANETEMIKNILHIVIDALESNQLTTIHSIMSIMNAGEILSDNRVINDINISAVVEIVKELTNSQLIAELFIPVYNAYVAPMFEGINNPILVELLSIDYYNYSVEKFQEDFKVIAELLELLDDEKALMKVMDLINKVDTTVVYPNSFEHIIRQAYKLNLIHDRTDLIREFIATLIGVDYFEIDHSLVDEEYDVDIIVTVVRMLCDILEENELTKIGDILDATKELSTHLTNENCIAIIDAVDKLLDLTTLHAFLIPTLDKYAAPVLPEGLKDIYNNENYVLTDLVEDLHSVLSIAKEVIYFDIIGILFDNQYIAWENTTPIENIIAGIFKLNILGNNLEYVVDYLNTIVPFVDLYNMDLANIDLANDGVVLGKAYAVIAREILASDLFPIHFLNDIKYMSFNTDDYLTKDVLNVVVDALAELSDSTILTEALYAAYITLLDVTPEKLQYLFEQDLTRPELVEDYARVLDILREAIELEVQNLLISTKPDITLVGASTHVNNILDIAIHSNLLGSDYARTAVGTFELFRITVAYADAASVNYEHDFEVVYRFIDGLFDILVSSELDSYFDIKEKIETMDLTSIDAIINDVQLVNNDNLHSVVDLLSLALELDLLNVAYNPVVDAFFGNMKGMLAPLFDSEEYPVDLFIEDVYALLDVVHEFIDFDVLGIYRDGAIIDWANVAPVEALITTVFTSNYLEVKLDDIINIVSDHYIDITDVDQDAIDLASDAERVVNAYRIIATNILAKPEFPVHYYDEIAGFSFYLRDYLTEENLNYVVDALVEISYTTIAEQALLVAYSYGDLYLPEDLAFLVSAELTGAELADDLRSVLEALRHAIALEVYNIYYEEDVTFVGASAHVNAILDKVLHTNIVSKDYVTFFAGLLSYAGIDCETEVLETVDFESDFVQIYDIIDDVFTLLIDSEIDSYFDAKDKFEYISSFDDILEDEKLANDTNILTVLDIVDSVIDLSIVKAVWEPLYNEYIGEVADESLFLEGLRDVERYSYDYFVEDAHAIVEMARNFVAFNGLALVRDDAPIDWTNVEPVQNIIKAVFDLNYLDVYDVELLNYLNSRLDTSILVDADIENIDWANDGAEFAEAYAIVALGLFTEEVFPIHHISDFGNVEINAKDFLTEEYVLVLIDAFEKVLDTTLVYELSIGVLDYANANLVPESAQFIIADADMTKELAVEDFHTLVDLARNAVEFGVIDYYYNENLFLDQPELIRAMIANLFDLHLTENSDTRIRAVNKVLRTIGLAEITSVSDWDNEERALTNIVNDVCAFLANNNIAYLTNLSDFIENEEFLDREFLSEENALAVLDILAKAVESEIITEVIAHIYNFEVVTRIPYESIMELVEFGTDPRDYNKELFIEDLKPMIELAKVAVELGIIDLYFDRDCEI
ncbi:MAG: hypothetical protein IKC22_00005, partial [Bacilli bacterium]|nr:hypothetical protein [Bacilli bacterium]